ncbi:pilus assembly protein [Bosea sp. LjRoot90]|uniref:TadE/TadG family type IV pilus assembly protein n=1 Tax=Bosea sp. LjRoot90 TaxID=3342342 RepID=UPI003ECC9525
MAKSGIPLINARRLVARLGKFRRDVAGSTAVEFAFIGMSFIVLMLGILQFALAFLAQMYIHDAVADAATGRTAGTYAGNRSAVVTQICARMIALDNCATNLRVETQPLASYPAAAQPVTGATFVAGTSGTMMLIRARAPVVTFVPGLPTLNVNAAALYTRP